ncbi:hypothetical protein [uncultured Thiocystis sp.]|jgi:hypothetical protein|uniref:hypothetical protein n=1 Tax=uncultured Thiocystis sp. TaxID=1202134 RepID=UPI0025D5C363|nr:hypothetical protein [uncultured Thiocystis sp.]
MHALKLNATVDSQRRLHLDLPPDTPEGEVEVIVLVPERSFPVESCSLRDFFRQLDAHPLERRYTREEIDAYLAEERESWGSP